MPPSLVERLIHYFSSKIELFQEKEVELGYKKLHTEKGFNGWLQIFSDNRLLRYAARAYVSDEIVTLLSNGNSPESVNEKIKKSLWSGSEHPGRSTDALNCTCSVEVHCAYVWALEQYEMHERIHKIIEERDNPKS